MLHALDRKPRTTRRKVVAATEANRAQFCGVRQTPKHGSCCHKLCLRGCHDALGTLKFCGSGLKTMCGGVLHQLPIHSVRLLYSLGAGTAVVPDWAQRMRQSPGKIRPCSPLPSALRLPGHGLRSPPSASTGPPSLGQRPGSQNFIYITTSRYVSLPLADTSPPNFTHIFTSSRSRGPSR